MTCAGPGLAAAEPGDGDLAGLAAAGPGDGDLAGLAAAVSGDGALAGLAAGLDSKFIILKSKKTETENGSQNKIIYNL